MGTDFEEVGKGMKFDVQPLTQEEGNDDANWETRNDDGQQSRCQEI